MAQDWNARLLSLVVDRNAREKDPFTKMSTDCECCIRVHNIEIINPCTIDRVKNHLNSNIALVAPKVNGLTPMLSKIVDNELLGRCTRMRTRMLEMEREAQLSKHNASNQNAAAKVDPNQEPQSIGYVRAMGA